MLRRPEARQHRHQGIGKETANGKNDDLQKMSEIPVEDDPKKQQLRGKFQHQQEKTKATKMTSYFKKVVAGDTGRFLADDQVEMTGRMLGEELKTTSCATELDTEKTKPVKQRKDSQNAIRLEKIESKDTCDTCLFCFV